MSKIPRIEGVFETCLYVNDLESSLKFYKKIFGFETLFEDQRAVALNVHGRHVLLLFKQGGSLKPMALPGGTIPSHDASGEIHFALAVEKEDLRTWRVWLQENHIEIESEVTWPLGGTSLYFRDPDRHLVELLTPGVWAIR